MPAVIHPSIAFGAERPEGDLWGYMAVSMLRFADELGDERVDQAINAARLYRRRPYPKNRERLDEALALCKSSQGSRKALLLTGMGNQVGQGVNVMGATIALCEALLAEDPSQYMRQANAYCRLLGL